MASSLNEDAFELHDIIGNAMFSCACPVGKIFADESVVMRMYFCHWYAEVCSVVYFARSKGNRCYSWSSVPHAVQPASWRAALQRA